jgi:pimeloyl-ACP methyl ester carboxylesterase
VHDVLDFHFVLLKSNSRCYSAKTIIARIARHSLICVKKHLDGHNIHAGSGTGLLLSAFVADPFASMAQAKHETRDIRIPPIGLAGTLHVPQDAYALVAFAHGSGSSRLSPRNRAVAGGLKARGIATLLFDLLTPDEEADRANVSDIPLLAVRLVDVVNWLDGQPSLAKLPLGLFGASTGAAAALVAATKLPRRVGAVVSRSGRPDLAGDALDRIATSFSRYSVKYDPSASAPSSAGLGTRNAIKLENDA